ncbi:MAG TPA: LysM peptidoglycan-binding domain-containing protein [Longimicrobiaceae bacterium]|nr:LysM peptidoglycan-binding domain-containing protein [Longimicrobiaceae bacterium]
MSQRLLAPAALLVLAACSPGASRAPARVPAPEPVVVPAVAPDTVEAGPELEEKELHNTSSALLGSVRYDLPMEANTWVATELDFLVNQRRSVIGRWLERAEQYQEFVKGVFAGYGLPTDLHHLAMVESGYLPTARSRAGAVGMWQFMPTTGRDMGLRIDDVVDERMDPVRSTHAAARHLRDLNGTFGGDWSLAAAAYNAGTGRITRGMRGVGAKNFWELAVWGTLAQETKQYVPRLYAVTIIARDRERFGFSPPLGVARPFAFDSIETDYAIPLAELAGMAGLPAYTLAELNPHLYRGTTPEGRYWVWVPKGSGQTLQAAYLDSEFRKHQGYGTYAVRRGDSAERLALLAGLTLSHIRELNPGVNVERLPPGTRLRLPRTAAQALAARPVERLAASEGAGESGRGRRDREEGRGKGDREEEPKRSERGERSGERERSSGSGRSESPERSGRGRSSRFAEHEVKEGETLWGLARRYGVEVEEIREANRLDGNTIVPGRTLRIPRKAEGSERAGSTARVARADSGESSRSRARSGERSASSERSPRERRSGEGSGDARVTRHVVKSGETLWGIARRYDSTVVAIRRANGMDEDSTLQPGQTLRIPRGD